MKNKHLLAKNNKQYFKSYYKKYKLRKTKGNLAWKSQGNASKKSKSEMLAFNMTYLWEAVTFARGHGLMMELNIRVKHPESET